MITTYETYPWTYACSQIFDQYEARFSYSTDRTFVIHKICHFFLYYQWRESTICMVQHYMIKFVRDLRQVGGFLWILRFPPLIKLTAMI